MTSSGNTTLDQLTIFPREQTTIASITSQVPVETIVGFLDYASKLNFGLTNKSLCKWVLAAIKEEDRRSGFTPLFHILREKGAQPTLEKAVLYAFKEKLTSINLSGFNNISNEDLEYLLQEVPGIREIKIAVSKINDISLEKIATHCPMLTSFVLEDSTEYCDITDKGVKALVERSPHLQTLTLNRCGELTSDTVGVIAKNCPDLRCLNLADSIYDLVAHTQPFTDLANHCTNLESLDLSSCTAATCLDIETIASRNTKLTHLSFERFALSEEQLLRVIDKCRNLKYVEFGHSKISSLVVKKMAENGLPLTHVLLADIDDEQVLELVQAFPNLRQMSFNGSNITDAAVSAIAAHCPRLRILELTDCIGITDASVDDLAASNLALTTLDLSGTAVTTRSLVKVSQRFQNLRSFTISVATDEGLTAVVQGCLKLRELRCHYSEITDASITAITANCSKLMHLSLFFCSSITVGSIQNMINQLTAINILEIVCCVSDEALQTIQNRNPNLFIYTG